MQINFLYLCISSTVSPQHGVNSLLNSLQQETTNGIKYSTINTWTHLILHHTFTAPKTNKPISNNQSYMACC